MLECCLFVICSFSVAVCASEVTCVVVILCYRGAVLYRTSSNNYRVKNFC